MSLFIERVNTVRVENGLWNLNEREELSVREWVEEVFREHAHIDMILNGIIILDIQYGKVKFLHSKDMEAAIKRRKRNKWPMFLFGVFMFAMLVLLTIVYAGLPEFRWAAWISGVFVIGFFAVMSYRVIML